MPVYYTPHDYAIIPTYPQVLRQRDKNSPLKGGAGTTLPAEDGGTPFFKGDSDTAGVVSPLTKGVPSLRGGGCLTSPSPGALESLVHWELPVTLPLKLLSLCRCPLARTHTLQKDAYTDNWPKGLCQLPSGNSVRL